MPSEVWWVLPLVGGFWFVFRTHLLRLTGLYLKQPIVVLLSAFVGAWFALVGRLITCLIAWLLHQAPWFPAIESSARKLFPWDFFGTGLTALLLAMAFAELCNSLLDKHAVNARVVNKYGSEILRMLHEAMVPPRPVVITLDNREVYVGFVQRIPRLDIEKPSVRILRIGRGYRDPDTLLPDIVDPVPPPDALLDELLVAIPLDAVKNVSLAQEDPPPV
jgi:hypothetical protein